VLAVAPGRPTCVDTGARVFKSGAERPPAVVTAGQLPVGRIVKVFMPGIHRSSHMRNVLADVIEGRMPVHLIPARREHRVFLLGAGSGDVGGAHHPDTDTLVAAGIDVTGMAHRHLVVGRVERADVHMIQTAFAADEDLIYGTLRLRPVNPGHSRLRHYPRRQYPSLARAFT